MLVKSWQTWGNKAKPVTATTDAVVVEVDLDVVAVAVVENTLTIQVRALFRFNPLVVTHPSTPVGLLELAAQTPRALIKSTPVKVCKV
jgi:uncharacterized membrane protein